MNKNVLAVHIMLTIKRFVCVHILAYLKINESQIEFSVTFNNAGISFVNFLYIFHTLPRLFAAFLIDTPTYHTKYWYLGKRAAFNMIVVVVGV